ncbi:YHYH protein [Cocleimonas sp. KMM 6892]|uniref:YHYH protein n=1 Tax=unclassified Cocleimonas TaxID=2639732 RepID=UPI002DBE7A68|nr:MULTISPECIES: YHYH protein [unclassified Cocleimonas]MEB8433034.1 YHYH protein [Cocleimonas sp. KMM 6892]MEC4715985.1 YHYH protein [Cocleimonas sp. KMM 6895]MEC4745446.1 YHYH protein [Cocleimonas sp. KMM 6896]
MTTKKVLGIKAWWLLSLVLLLSTSYSYAHSGSTTKAAWDACDNKSKSQSCEFKGVHKGLYRGTCQSISSSMMCVRNKPIIPKTVDGNESHSTEAITTKSSSTVTAATKLDGTVAIDNLIKGNLVKNKVVVNSHAVDTSLFAEGAIVGDVETVDCTLSGGTKTTCYKLTIAGAPADPDTSPEGPYCPQSITSSADEGGTWIDGEGTVYDVDGKFIENLSTLYKDKKWQMYDIKTGKVTVITGERGCEVAGDPRPIPGFNNFCLECRLKELDGGIKKTVLIPTTPVPVENPTDVRGRDNTGVALNGVLLGPPAPLAMILSSYSLGVLDDCGAHANPHEGYHYHAANGCSEIGIQKDGHSPMIGYALDGYAIFAKTDKSSLEAKGLDECGGETDDTRGYHYHASAPGKNEIFGCFMGEKGSFEGGSDQGGLNHGRPGGPRPEHGPDNTPDKAPEND